MIKETKGNHIVVRMLNLYRPLGKKSVDICPVLLRHLSNQASFEYELPFQSTTRFFSSMNALYCSLLLHVLFNYKTLRLCSAL